VEFLGGGTAIAIERSVEADSTLVFARGLEVPPDFSQIPGLLEVLGRSDDYESVEEDNCHQ